MKIDTQLKLSKTKILLPCTIFILLATILFIGSVLLFMYSFVILAATSSPMVFFTLFASSFIATGLGLFFSDYGDRFLQKYLHTYGDKNNPCKLIHDPKEAKTLVEKIFSLSNVYTAVLILGVIFTIICASLGALEHSNWNTAFDSYMEETGYYGTPSNYTVPFDQDFTEEQINEIAFNLDENQGVVIYYNDVDKDNFIYVNGYQTYKNQIVTQKNNNKITISKNAPPELKRAKDKMLFFMFIEHDAAKQIRIYIPNSLKDTVKITGNYIVAK